MLGREEGGEDELIDGSEDELLKSVEQNASWLVNELVIASQWVASFGRETGQHYVQQSHQQGDQAEGLQLKGIHQAVYKDMLLDDNWGV